MLDGVVNEERFEKIAGDVADAVAEEVIHEELDFFEMGEAAAFVFGDAMEKIENFFGGGLANAAAFAGVGVTESDFVAFADGGEDLDGIGVATLFFEMAEVVEGIDDGGVESVVLLGGRMPEEEWVEVQRDVFVEEGDGEVGLGLGSGNAVVVSEARADYGHGVL